MTDAGNVSSTEHRNEQRSRLLVWGGLDAVGKVSGNDGLSGLSKELFDPLGSCASVPHFSGAPQRLDWPEEQWIKTLVHRCVPDHSGQQWATPVLSTNGSFFVWSLKCC